jgi:hypothetical protein
MRGTLLTLILASTLAGCGGKMGKSSAGFGRDSSPEGPASVQQKPAPGGTGFVDWTPANVEITCAQGTDCPPQAGLLIFVAPAVKGRHSVHKCTAFLTAPAQIMSNGHCDFSKNSTGYFVTALSAPGGRQIRKVVSVQAKKYTQHSKGPELDSGRPDAAVFNLDSPLSLAPLQLANLRDPQYQHLVGFVLNSETNEKYSLVRIDCTVRRHEALFPFNPSENPDVLTAFNCFARRGNSGGPLFAPDSWKVQAIVQGGGDPSKLASQVLAEFNRPLHVYERHWTIKATNVRCLDAPPGVCTKASLEETAARFAAHQRRAFIHRPGSNPLQFNEWAEIIPPTR